MPFYLYNYTLRLIFLGELNVAGTPGLTGLAHFRRYCRLSHQRCVSINLKFIG